jgi:plastocyanin
MKRFAICAILAAALFAGQAAYASQPGPAQASGAKAVDIDHFKFTPHKLEIAKGTKVTFSNSAAVAHTATDPGAFDSGPIKPGDSFAVRFDQKGTFAYHCEIHPFMHGKIVVR